MYTNSQANSLLQLPKKIVYSDSIYSKFELSFGAPVSERIDLVSESSDESFILDLNQSKKNSFKVTLHHQVNDTFVGLLRVDFSGQHKNPSVLKDSVPDFIKPYQDKWFDFSEHHIHYYVEGYKPLSWAIPLINDDFKIKNIVNMISIKNAIKCFCKRINVVTVLEISITEDLWTG
jgi:hypothetical protein